MQDINALIGTRSSCVFAGSVIEYRVDVICCCGFMCGGVFTRIGSSTDSDELFEVHSFKLALTVDLDLPAGLIVAVYTVGAVSEIEDGVRELLGGRIAVFE